MFTSNNLSIWCASLQRRTRTFGDTTFLQKGRHAEPSINIARLAQSAERKALNLVVVGSSPTVGVSWALDFYRQK